MIDDADYCQIRLDLGIRERQPGGRTADGDDPFTLWCPDRVGRDVEAAGLIDQHPHGNVFQPGHAPRGHKVGTYLHDLHVTQQTIGR